MSEPSIDWLIDWLIEWLIDRLIDWLIDWWIVRLIDWLIVFSADHCGVLIVLPSLIALFVSLCFPNSDIDDVSELSEARSINSLNSDTSTTATADTERTLLEDLSFLTELSDCRIGAGQVARFHCELLGQRALTVTWHHGNRMIEHGGRYRIYRRGSKHSLEIYFTTFADSGAVVCRAMGVDSVAESCARLRIRGTEWVSPAIFIWTPINSLFTNGFVPNKVIVITSNIQMHKVIVGLLYSFIAFP